MVNRRIECFCNGLHSQVHIGCIHQFVCYISVREKFYCKKLSPDMEMNYSQNTECYLICFDYRSFLCFNSIFQSGFLLRSLLIEIIHKDFLVHITALPSLSQTGEGVMYWGIQDDNIYLQELKLSTVYEKITKLKDVF